jgi:hypothetical protein
MIAESNLSEELQHYHNGDNNPRQCDRRFENPRDWPVWNSDVEHCFFVPNLLKQNSYSPLP